MSRARGADFSSAQSIRELQQVRGSIDFAIVKATQGTGYVSPVLAGQVLELRKTHVTVGAYHFLTPDEDGVRQWDHFESVIGKLGIRWVAVDHEALNGVIPADHVAEAFIRRGRQRGYKVGRYGSSGVTMARNLGEAWRWVADYAATPPRVRWDVWQFSDGGGRQDWNQFRGTPNELAAFVASLTPKAKAKPVAARWWLRDMVNARSMGPYRLGVLVAKLPLYAARHPGVGAYTVERK